jgi:L-iditol 2-dehydrogenase
MCTEYKKYVAGESTDVLGHEAAGEVVAVAQPGKVKVGDRVVVMPQYPCGKCSLCLAGDYIHCQQCVDPLMLCGSETGTATYAQYCIKQDWLLLPIPDGMSYDHASMACCGLGPAFGAMQYMNLNSFDTVLVAGMGPVGLGGIVNARYRGARVIAVASDQYRATLAKKLGAELTVDIHEQGAIGKIMQQTGGVGADKSMDCAGTAAAQRLLIDATRRRGTVCFIGESGDLTIHVSNDTIRKGLTLRGIWHWNLADSHLMMKMIADSTVQLNAQITHTFPLGGVKKAWELQISRACGKIILHPWA